MAVEQQTQILAIDDEKGIEILYTTFPKLPFISFIEYDDGEITFSKHLNDLLFHYKIEMTNDFPTEEIVDAMLDLANKFKKIYDEGMQNDNPERATMFCDKRDKAKQFYYMMINEHFSEKVMYEFAKNSYSSIECNYGYDLLFESMKRYISRDINIKKDIRKSLEGHIKGSILEVYRGINKRNRKDGLSFTLDKKVAKFFADRWKEEGYINKYEVHIDDVVAFIDNEEQEIITKNAKLIEEHIKTTY